MENNCATEMTEALAKSLDDTQKNATQIDKLVEHVCVMSNQETHNQIITSIVTDDKIEWEKKIDLIQKADEKFDQRMENNTRRTIDLQSAQSQNIQTTTSWWGRNWGWVALGGLALVGVATPGGRKAISSASKYLFRPRPCTGSCRTL